MLRLFPSVGRTLLKIRDERSGARFQWLRIDPFSNDPPAGVHKETETQRHLFNATHLNGYCEPQVTFRNSGFVSHSVSGPKISTSSQSSRSVDSEQYDKPPRLAEHTDLAEGRVSRKSSDSCLSAGAAHFE